MIYIPSQPFCVTRLLTTGSQKKIVHEWLEKLDDSVTTVRTDACDCLLESTGVAGVVMIIAKMDRRMITFPEKFCQKF